MGPVNYPVDDPDNDTLAPYMGDRKGVPAAMVVRFTARNQADLEATFKLFRSALSPGGVTTAYVCTDEALVVLNETLTSLGWPAEEEL